VRISVFEDQPEAARYPERGSSESGVVADLGGAGLAWQRVTRSGQPIRPTSKELAPIAERGRGYLREAR
jgi:hypothetical protein